MTVPWYEWALRVVAILAVGFCFAMLASKIATGEWLIDVSWWYS